MAADKSGRTRRARDSSAGAWSGRLASSASSVARNWSAACPPEVASASAPSSSNNVASALLAGSTTQPPHSAKAVAVRSIRERTSIIRGPPFRHRQAGAWPGAAPPGLRLLQATFPGHHTDRAVCGASGISLECRWTPAGSGAGTETLHHTHADAGAAGTMCFCLISGMLFLIVLGAVRQRAVLPQPEVVHGSQ